MTRSFCQQSLLLLLLAACARRERPYVPAAAAVDSATPRLVLEVDGQPRFRPVSKRLLIDAPGRLRMRDLSPIVERVFSNGTRELDALVDTASGEGQVPLRFSAATSGFGYAVDGRIHLLWQIHEPLDLPGARVRPGRGS